MRISSLQADEASEEVAESFLDGGSGVDSFLKQYVEARSLVHLRKAKLDQFRRIVRSNRS